MNYKLIITRSILIIFSPLILAYNIAIYLPCMAIKFLIIKDFRERFLNFYYTEKHNIRARWLAAKRVWSYYKGANQ